MKALAVMDMYAAYENAREAFDKAEHERDLERIRNEANKKPPKSKKR